MSYGLLIMFLMLISDMSIIHTITYCVWYYNVACIIFIFHKQYWILYFCTVIWNDVLQFTFIFHKLKYTSVDCWANHTSSHHYFFEFIWLSSSSPSFSFKIIQLINIFISIIIRYFSIHQCYRIKTPLLSSPVVTVI
jgi:hypothetical protein